MKSITSSHAAESVTGCAGAHRTIAACGFEEADITLNGYLPGEEIPREEARNATLSVFAKVSRGAVEQVRVYSGAELIHTADGNGTDTVNIEIPLAGLPINEYIRVEIQGMNQHWGCNSTPFWIR